MMRREKTFIIVFGIAFYLMVFSVCAMAINSKVGSAAYTFLKIGTGAKSQGLGGAFVGLADDETALYYNPAGLSIFDPKTVVVDELLGTQPQKTIKNGFTASYINYLLDFQYGFLGYTRRLDDNSKAGVSMAYQNYGTFNRLDTSGDKIGTFGASDMALGFTYSRRLKPSLSIGTTAKLIYEKIDVYSSTGLASDIGFMYLADAHGTTRIGVALTNLGFQLSGLTDSRKDPLPTKFSVGMSHKLKELPFVFAVEAGKPFDNDFYLCLGSELVSFKPLYLRIGWTTAGKDYKVGDDSDFLAGFAGGFGYSYKNHTIDYSYSSYGDLGSVHRISLGGGF